MEVEVQELVPTDRSSGEGIRPRQTMKVQSGLIRAPWLILALLSFGSLLSGFDRLLLVMLIEPIKRDLLISDVEVGILLGPAFAIFHLAAALPVGWLVDRISRSRIIAVGLAVWSGATAASGLGSSFIHLLLARCFVGAGEASLSPAGQSLLSELFPKEKLARAMAIVQSGSNIGAGFAFLLGGGLIAILSVFQPANLPGIGAVHTWQLAFLIAGVPGIILAAVILMIKDPRRVKNPPARQSSLRPLLLFIRSRWSSLAALIGALACMCVVQYAFMSWVPALLVRNRGFGLIEVGFMMGIGVGVCGMIGCLLGGTLGDYWLRRGHKAAYMWVGIVSALCSAPLGMAFLFIEHSYTLSFILIWLYLIAAHLSVPGIQAGLQLTTPQQFKGQIAAITIITTNLIGMGLGPVLVPLLGRFFGTSNDLSLPLAAVIIFFLGVMLAICLLGRRPMAAALSSDIAPHVQQPC